MVVLIIRLMIVIVKTTNSNTKNVKAAAAAALLEQYQVFSHSWLFGNFMAKQHESFHDKQAVGGADQCVLKH